MRQPHTLVAIVASLGAFILLLLALLAGSSPGFMENYDIVSFNTSGLGKNLIENFNTEEPSPTQSEDSDCDKLPEFMRGTCTKATAAVESLKTEVEDTVNEIGNQIADKLADRLGIHEFYSLHALTICEGDFTPNATADGASRNVSSCTRGFTDGYNVSAYLDHGLEIGPFELTLNDLGFTDDLQGAVDKLAGIVKAYTIILILGVAFTGLSLLASIAALFLSNSREHVMLLANLVIATLAVTLLIIGGLLVTIGAHMGAKEANAMGDDIGLNIRAGTGYTVITWVAVGLMLTVFACWLSRFLKFRKGKTGRVAGSRKHARDSEESGAYYEGNRPEMRAASGVKFGRSRH